MRHATAALAVLVSCLGTGACSASANLPFQVTPMAEFDDSVWEHLAGTQSEPFVLGEHRRIAIKVIDERGNELMVVRSASEAE